MGKNSTKTKDFHEGVAITPLRVAVSARSLFNLEESHSVFELEKDLDAYLAHAKSRQEDPLEPAAAFPLMKALLNLNALVPQDTPLVDATIVSSIHPPAGLRIINSLAHHDLPIKRATFTGGAPTVPYLRAYGVDLFLSKSLEDVQQAVNAGIASAVMYDSPKSGDGVDDDFQIKIAIDGDAVIFTDASERIYKAGGENGLKNFLEHEQMMAKQPLEEGPFAKVLRVIASLQAVRINGRKPFRIIVVTARGGSSRERVLRTFDVWGSTWGIEIDEIHFLSGFKKAPILQVIRPHIFFDDQEAHVKPASEVVPSGLVPWVEKSDFAA
jgi:5''-nucleotidase.